MHIFAVLMTVVSIALASTAKVEFGYFGVAHDKTVLEEPNLCDCFRTSYLNGGATCSNSIGPYGATTLVEELVDHLLGNCVQHAPFFVKLIKDIPIVGDLIGNGGKSLIGMLLKIVPATSIPVAKNGHKVCECMREHHEKGQVDACSSSIQEPTNILKTIVDIFSECAKKK